MKRFFGTSAATLVVLVLVASFVVYPSSAGELYSVSAAGAFNYKKMRAEIEKELGSASPQS